MEVSYQYTVCTQCFTFNQENYILDALNGFVAQNTSFPVVYVIVDDASTDNEPQILRNYFERHFNHHDLSIAYKEETEYGTILYGQHVTNKHCYFAILLLKENHYSQKKDKTPYLSRWRKHSKYIALCEGDDYWTDPLKLQKQIDYMDSHPDCKLCVHCAEWEVEGVLRPMGCQCKESFDLSLEESIRNGGLYIATASFLYRQEIDQEWPKWRVIAHIGDFPLQLLCGLKGRVHVLADTMCVYRFDVKDLGRISTESPPLCTRKMKYSGWRSLTEVQTLSIRQLFTVSYLSIIGTYLETEKSVLLSIGGVLISRKLSVGKG